MILKLGGTTKIQHPIASTQYILMFSRVIAIFATHGNVRESLGVKVSKVSSLVFKKVISLGLDSNRNTAKSVWSLQSAALASHPQERIPCHSDPVPTQCPFPNCQSQQSYRHTATHRVHTDQFLPSLVCVMAYNATLSVSQAKVITAWQLSVPTLEGFLSSVSVDTLQVEF